MRQGARLAAAVEILTDLSARPRPAADAVRDWMLSHRFAGARDRSAIGDLVFCALRWRQSSAARLGEDTERAWVLGAVAHGLGWGVEGVEHALLGDAHAPAALSDDERTRLTAPAAAGAPSWIEGDYPEWLDAEFRAAFGDKAGPEGAALAVPAGLDLRANTLKTDRARFLAALSDLPRLPGAPAPTPHAPHGVRLPWAMGQAFNWSREPLYERGWFEVQDEGSQLAALLCAARPGMQVADVCAGAGGKTLALAAMMDNRGQVHAHDVQSTRLGPLLPRLRRAGVRNTQVHVPRRSGDVLAPLVGTIDVALVDAPCTGSGTWRRAPDAKWRLRPAALERRLQEQQQALDLAWPLVRPGGRLVYVTCSVLPSENDGAVEAFVRRTPDARVGRVDAPATLQDAAHATRHGLQMTPLRTGTDGFYVAVVVKPG